MAGAAVLAALVAGGATASAATETQRAKPRPAAVTPAKSTQLQKLARADGQYTGLVRRVKQCPASAPVLRSAAKERTAAVKKASTSSVRVLRAKHKRLSKAVQVLARFEAGCARAGTSVVTATPQPTPGAAPGSVSFNLAAPAALGAPLIDLGPLLGGGTLPAQIQLVTPGSLTAPLCAANGAVCVAIDPNGLLGALRDLVARVPLVGPLATPLLDEINRLLVGGDLNSIFEVRRISDTVIQLVPEGPLATLAALLGDTIGEATAIVGRIQVV